MKQSLKDRVEWLSKRTLLGLLRVLLRVPAVPKPLDGPFTSILVVRQHDQLGDMLCVIPLLRALRLRFPGCRLDLVTAKVNHEIMRNHPFVNDVILYPRGNYIAMIPFYLRLRRNKYDLAIVPSTVSVSVTSALIALVSGAPVRCGAGSINGEETLTSPCFSVPVRLDWRSDPHRHQTLRNLDVAEPLNLGQTDLTTVIGLTEWERASATATLAELRGRHRFLLGVHPGAGKLENRWDTGKYISVINRLAENYPLGVVISVGPQDSDLREQILSSLRCDFIVLDHRPLRELAAAIDQLDCFLSNDTGIMHIAGAVRTHLLALFGPSDYLQWMPQGSNNRFLRGQDGTMTSIGEEDVYRELSAMLAQISTPG